MLVGWLLAALAADVRVAVDVEGPEGPVALEEAALPHVWEHEVDVDGAPHLVRVQPLPGDDGSLVYLVSVAQRRPGDRERVLLAAQHPAGPAWTPLRVTVPVGRGRRAPPHTLSLTWGATSAPPAPPTTSPEGWPAPSRRFTVLWNDADLFANVYRKGAPEHRTGPVDRTTPSAQASVYRAVFGFQGTVREVESVTDLAPHCYDSAPPLKPYPYQYFAQRQDFLTVTTRPIVVDHPDGTGVRLAAGVAVTARPDGRHDVDVAGLRFVLTLPEDAVGAEYAPGPPLAAEPIALMVRPDADGVVGRLGGEPVRFSGDALPLHGRDGVRAPIVVARAACVELRLAVPPSRLAVP